MKKSSALNINDLKLNVHLGWPKSEREQTQTVILNLKIQFEVPPRGCATDQLENTFCYGKMIADLRDFLLDKHFHLIEHLCHILFEWLKKQFPTNATLTLTLTKFPSIKELGGVSFSMGD